MKKTLFATVLALATSVSTIISAQSLRAPPVDEGPTSQSFSAFRDQLLKAIERRDVEYVVRQASKDIHLSFGGTAGRDALREKLTVNPDNLSDEYRHLASKMRAENWAELEKTLRLGGRFQENGTVFVAPYTWSVDLPETADPFETYFVTGDRVALRSQPTLTSPVITRLSYDIVTLLEEGEGTPFQRVRLVNGTTGYTHGDYLRSAVDYRAFFAYKNGSWQMTVFIAGD
ncbi:SH3 domain-containing protein [Alisedimentitalea sp. MJ-SS2]|uniref:SH3 domain-containing protein n=1 Tax=Aliisedimentitalea sp. MJ-SS2 TaxID=3049795 RepID=UPI002908E41F|nr:SH3 domain-containing protein [Alisedimentitalea sp. MJ-SS2]MDU8926205.1 SH3 domain-containing protein [Alisedimentitalea sp. MJ-SS2]